ncbi:MAG: DUF2752 domain-containing protein [Acidobacteria bacterium]|nr:DUF2752 domain-containing protein [Acidobacteriota bacterium]
MPRRGLLWWLLGLVGILVFAGLRVWNPESSGFQICVFRTLLDLPCPGCGLTRAMSLLAHGSLRSALDVHPLAPLLALEAGLGWVAWGVLGRDRLGREIALRAEVLVLANAVPLLGLWLGRAATGSLPF